MDWTATARDFRRYLLTTGRSEGTARTYVANLSIFYIWCARRECLPHDVDRQAIRSWLAERRESVSSGRAHNDLAALRLFYAWLREDGYRPDNPTENVQVKRTKALPTQPLSAAELAALVGACRCERDRLIVLMLAATGLRISELAALRADAIDWQRGEVRVRGKGDKERRVAPNPEVLGRLHAYLGMFPQGPVWLSQRRHEALSAHQLRKILYGVAAAARLEGVHPHRLRSYFATNYIEQFADIQALQGVMGHESIETTARYSESSRERRGLEQMRRFNLAG